MSQPLLTVCITTFNRSKITCNLLDKLFFDSRVEYLLVDDGSLPEHLDMVDDYIQSQGLSVTLLTKQNGGKLSALIYGLQYARGKYFTDLDSDDTMNQQHILNILDAIQEVERIHATGENVIGVCGLSETPDETTFGDPFPTGLRLCPYIKMRLDYKVWGNKVEVIQTDALKKISVSFFTGEKRMPTNVLWYSLNDQSVLFLNTPFEMYSPNRADSISNNIRAIQVGSPNSTRASFKIIFQKKRYYKRLSPYLSAIVNYQRFSWHGARPFFETELTTKETFLIACSIPLGFLLYCWDLFCLMKDSKNSP